MVSGFYLVYNVVREGGIMYVRSWKKGNKLYASIVKSVRIGSKVRQETVAYLGAITEEQLPYLKAAYAKNKPRLVYDNEKEDNE